MRRFTFAALTLALFAGLAGCESDWSLRGHVVAADSADKTSGGLAPIAFAKVVLHCADKSDSVASDASADVVVLADRSGAFELAGPGQGPRLDCKLQASAPGRAVWSASVDEICADDGEGQGRCVNGAAIAALSPAE